MNLNVQILLHDTLQALGLRYILKDLYGITPNISLNIDTEGKDTNDLYIVDNIYFISNLDYFIPRRNKVLVLTDKEILCHDIVLNTAINKDDLISNLGQILKQIEHKSNEETHNDLSQREIDVLRLIAMGKINKEIADELNISINTVLSHRKNLTSKLDIKSVSGLSVYAMMNGYIKNDK